MRSGSRAGHMDRSWLGSIKRAADPVTHGHEILEAICFTYHEFVFNISTYRNSRIRWHGIVITWKCWNCDMLQYIANTSTHDTSSRARQSLAAPYALHGGAARANASSRARQSLTAPYAHCMAVLHAQTLAVVPGRAWQRRTRSAWRCCTRKRSSCARQSLTAPYTLCMAVLHAQT